MKIKYCHLGSSAFFMSVLTPFLVAGERKGFGDFKTKIDMSSVFYLLRIFSADASCASVAKPDKGQDFGVIYKLYQNHARAGQVAINKKDYNVRQ